MSDVWKSTEQKFCKYCKCWVADNKVSWAGHENGVRHKKNVADKITEIKKQQAASTQAAKDQQHWIRKMEEAALRDYKKKDLTSNRDFTAKLYNNEDLPDVEKDTYQDIEQQQQQPGGGGKEAGSGVIGPQKPRGTNYTPKTVDPMLQPTGDAPDRWDKDYDKMKQGGSAEPSMCPIRAPVTGTKWHNTPAPKLWYEAKTPEGNSYFWHVDSHESRWDVPEGGFVSVAEQAKLQITEETKQHKKKRVAEASKFFHGEHQDRPKFDSGPGLPDVKVDPYGGGGWKKVERVEEPKVDLGLPAPKVAKYVPPTIHREARPDFKEKTIDSLGGGGAGVRAVSAPVINFRKRKNPASSLRTREEDG